MIGFIIGLVVGVLGTKYIPQNVVEKIRGLFTKK